MMVFAGLGAAVNAAQPQPRTSTFHFEYKAIVKDISPGVKRIDLWVPVPR